MECVKITYSDIPAEKFKNLCYRIQESVHSTTYSLHCLSSHLKEMKPGACSAEYYYPKYHFSIVHMKYWREFS
jgi:hypothetical protein